jgi:hypothetical protein
MTQVEQIKAEIEKRIRGLAKEAAEISRTNSKLASQYSAIIVELGNILSIINSLTECQQVSHVVSDDLKTIVDKEAREVWNEINTGHDYSIIDSFSQFYGICIQMAECSAKWQKQQTIDKAAEWLECAGKYHWYDPIEHNEGFGTGRLIEDFKKYMED